MSSKIFSFVILLLALGSFENAFCQDKNFKVKLHAGVYTGKFLVTEKTYINDTTYTYLSLVDDLDIMVGSDLYYNLFESTKVYSALSIFPFSPTANIRMGQTLNTSTGSIIVYDSWGTSYSFIRTNLAVGLSQRINEFIGINAGIGLNFNISTKEPFIGDNPGKFYEIANAMVPIYKTVNSMYQLGASFKWKKFSLNGNYQRTISNETKKFSIDTKSYSHQSRLEYWTISIGYEF